MTRIVSTSWLSRAQPLNPVKEERKIVLKILGPVKTAHEEYWIQKNAQLALKTESLSDRIRNGRLKFSYKANGSSQPRQHHRPGKDEYPES